MSGLLDEILTFLNSHWPDAKDFFNSVFFMAIFTAIAGFRGRICRCRRRSAYR